MSDPNSGDLKLFATRLRERREANGMSQQDLAKRLGVTVDAVQNWERAKNFPRLKTRPLLCEVLDTPPDYFHFPGF